jgi:type IV secretion system protein VirB3
MQAEAIFKGATRPAMLLGIPLVPLVSLTGTALLAALWGGMLISMWVAIGALSALIPALAWMRWITERDDQRLHQMFVAVKLGQQDRNHRFWGARSYSPTLFKGANDAWRR